MADVNNNVHEQMAENNLAPEYVPNQNDGQFALVTGDDQVSMDHEPYVPETPPIISTIPPGAPMETIMAALVNAINRQGGLIREQNQRFEEQNQRLAVIE
ncbi:hypothetical protein A2U01_0050936, partial [Trifolium medium]|nr:hypothetical protein [Trifolium medium]